MAGNAGSPEEQRGMKLLADADKKANVRPGGFLSSVFGGGSSRLDDAIDLYCQAANQLKMAKNWEKAGYAFTQAAMLNLQTENKNEAAMKYIDASVCYKKVNPKQAIETLKKAVEIQTEMGRFSMAAKQHITIAEIYESEDPQNIDQAIVHYEKAADYYQGEESQSHAGKCLLKVAHYAAEREDYMKAIQIFEQIANRNAENALLKYSAKEYYFKAALCHLCVDPLNAQHALARYEETFPSFQDTRESGLLKKVLGCMEDSNVDGFTDAVKEYDSISRLDQWTTALLVRAKRTLGEADLT